MKSNVMVWRVRGWMNVSITAAFLALGVRVLVAI